MPSDCVLENIERIMREKRLKLETVSKASGISKGEFSKIINGKRQEYQKHLLKIAEALGVTELDLTTPIKSSSSENTNPNPSEKKTNEELYERLIGENKDRIELQYEIINGLRSDLNFWKEEFIKLQEKIKKIEKRL